MSTKTVTMEMKNRICVVTLNQPDKLNALSDDMARDFKEIIEGLKTDPEPKVVIVTGAGRSFSAGGDLHKMKNNIGADPAMRKKNALDFYTTFFGIMDLEVPTIAAINGHAMGAGACLALGCDMRCAAMDSRIGFTFVKIGLYPGMGADYFLPRIVGRARAFELLMTGDTITAVEAHRIGLVNHIIPPEDLMERTLELAQKIASMPVFPIRMLKQSIDAGMESTLSETLHRATALQALCYTTNDLKEGIDAAIGKRPPRFSDEYR